MNVFPPGGTAREPASTESFVDAMAMAVSGVTVLASDGPAGRGGITVSAFTSVSAEPPMVLACVNRKSAIVELVSGNAHFSVNILAESHQRLSEIFAGRAGVDRATGFAEFPWETGLVGQPVLQGATASFECALSQSVDIGTHRVFFGLVLQARSGTALPLAYSGRAYRGLK